MRSIDVVIKPVATKARKIRIEVDANKFERLAADFGLFNPDFVASLDQAEKDLHSGRIKKLSSLRDLRRSR